MEFLQNMAKKNSVVANQVVKPTAAAKIMASADDISLWYEGVQMYEAGLIDEALEVFKTKVKKSAKMIINTGCCYLRKNDLKTAEETFKLAAKQDKHMALAFFYLGLTEYFLSNYEEALTNFETTFTLLRGNNFVDYRQLGYKYQLYACEVLANQGACHVKLNNTEKASQCISQAFEKKSEKKHERIFDMIQYLETGKQIQPFVPPQSEIFRPSKAQVANLEKKNYLATAKVISTDSEEDCFACFSGIKDKVIEQKKEERRKSSLVPPNTPSQTLAAQNKQNAPRKGSTAAPLFPALPSDQQQAAEPQESMDERLARERRMSNKPSQPLPNRPASENNTEDDSFAQKTGPIRKSRSVGSKPSKPLPRLSQIIAEEKAKSTIAESILEEPPEVFSPVNDENNNPFEEVEVDIMYSFVSKICLPIGFTLADLQKKAVQQPIPQNVEFRVADPLGRQVVLNEEQLQKLFNNNSKPALIQCFPAS